jgi:hypothetical protein
MAAAAPGGTARASGACACKRVTSGALALRAHRSRHAGGKHAEVEHDQVDDHERLRKEEQPAVFDLVADGQWRGDGIASRSCPKGRRPEPRKGTEAEGRPLRGEDDRPRPGGPAAGLPVPSPGVRAGTTTRRAWSEERNDDRSEHRSCRRASLRRQCQRLQRPSEASTASPTAWREGRRAREVRARRAYEPRAGARRASLAALRVRPFSARAHGALVSTAPLGRRQAADRGGARAR